jgi:hypothetical protein
MIGSGMRTFFRGMAFRLVLGIFPSPTKWLAASERGNRINIFPQTSRANDRASRNLLEKIEEITRIPQKLFPTTQCHHNFPAL